MKYVLSILWIFYNILAYSQNEDYNIYSYTEFFKMIEEEQDSVFELGDAIIKYDLKIDQRFRAEISPNQKKDTLYKYLNDIIIDKHLKLNNVQFKYDLSDRVMNGALYDIYFKKSVSLRNSSSLFISYCRFEEDFEFIFGNCEFEHPYYGTINNFINITYSSFKDFRMSKSCRSGSKLLVYYLDGNTFSSNNVNHSFSIFSIENGDFYFTNNEVEYKRHVFLSNRQGEGVCMLNNNRFVCDFITLTDVNFKGNLIRKNNFFSSPVLLDTDTYTSDDVIGWSQFANNYISSPAFTEYTEKVANRFPIQLEPELRKEYVKQYRDSARFFDKNYYGEEISLKGNFYNHFRNKYNIETANEVYLELKDFETKRLQIQYEQNQNFRTYFKWKVNQFLKLFSDYGTEPSKAIVFSLYVIIFFAIIYLFFPNSWDSHGRNRIIDRYTFFMKYMRRKAGIHEVYLEDKKEEMLTYEKFKSFIDSSEHEVPKIFTATALPLYKWAISGTIFSSGFLKRIDIMKGTWRELPQGKRWWKGILLTGAFTIAIIYDLLIKMLNALMLSINTFTTLGFGEIPIKGLPRYLAIIQGFIGWFMLTIFSVSLISQLLN